MGINDVARQIQAEQNGSPTGTAPWREQPGNRSGTAPGALNAPQAPRPLMSTDQKLLLLGSTIAGLLAVNTALLALLLVRV